MNNCKENIMRILLSECHRGALVRPALQIGILSLTILKSFLYVILIPRFSIMYMIFIQS